MKKSLLASLLVLIILVGAVSACSNAATPTVTEAATEEAATEDVTTEEVVTEETVTEEAATDEAAPNDAEVKALIEERCSVCHSASIVYSASFDEKGWSDVIDNMIGKGADVSDEEKALMIDWLLAQP